MVWARAKIWVETNKNAFAPRIREIAGAADDCTGSATFNACDQDLPTVVDGELLIHDSLPIGADVPPAVEVANVSGCPRRENFARYIESTSPANRVRAGQLEVREAVGINLQSDRLPPAALATPLRPGVASAAATTPPPISPLLSKSLRLRPSSK